ncbi:MAG: hypothetical protein PHO20_03195 [Candidatus Peribacteraceae bacterium]|nr:hypothetical protein [Candidatus Peribacteraceae bacterium]MDD5739747.1 hypothetical protein [Candidatus Peribacteraceae bacterium]
MASRLLEELCSAEGALVELGKGHLASIQNDANNLLPLDRTKYAQGQQLPLPRRQKGGCQYEGMIVRSEHPSGTYGKDLSVYMTGSRTVDLPAAAEEGPKEKKEQQRVDVRFDDGRFEVRVNEQSLWSEGDGVIQLLPGALPLIVERLIAMSAFLRETHNPQVIQRVEKAQQAIRNQLDGLGVFQWGS